MALLKEIAKEAKVSLATVSRVLNKSDYVSENKRIAVLNAAKKLGYKTSKHSKKAYEKMISDIVGIVVADINNPFFSEVTKGITHVLKEKNINALICDTDESPEQEIKALQTLRREKVGGIIITPASEAVEYNAEYINELKSLGISIVLLDRDIKLSGFDGVFLDSYKGAFEAVKLLIANGHSDIAIIAGLITSKPGIDRLNGYLEALRQNNLPIKEEYIMYGNFKKEMAYKLTKKLLNKKNRVTAIFSSNNLMSVGCLEAISELGLKIPEDISFVSFDDFYFFDTFGFKISVIERPTIQMGIEAANILIEKMKKGKREKEYISKRIILSPNLVIRGSEKYPINRIKR